jgi:hypothetical protein
MEMPLYERTSDGNCGVLGFRMCQNRLAVSVLSYLIETGGFRQVIELGTQLGGLSALLGLQCRMVGARFDTFDKEAASPYSGWFALFGVNYRILDVFSPTGTAAVRELIQAPGRVLLLCDNGDKKEEFARFAPYLKAGDVIGAHDYHPDGDYQERRWGWHEITDAAVEETCRTQGLVPYHQEDCTEAAWLMRIKE